MAIAILPWRSVKGTRCCCWLLPLLLICWIWGIATGSSLVQRDSSSHLTSFISFSKFQPDECAASWCRSPAASIGQLHHCSWRQWETDMESSLCLMVLVCSHEFQFALDLSHFMSTFFFLTAFVLTFGTFRSSVRWRGNSLQYIYSPSLIIVYIWCL